MTDTKIKKSWYKRWWAITLFIIIGLAIIGNLFGGNNSSSSGGILSIGNSGDCPKELVPDRIKVNCSEYEKCKDNQSISGFSCSCMSIDAEDYTWTDGVAMTKGSNTNFRKATQAGENVNYLYSWSYAIYDKIPLNSDGTIGKQINYGMFLSIDPKDKTDDGYKIVEYKCSQAYSEWVKI